MTRDDMLQLLRELGAVAYEFTDAEFDINSRTGKAIAWLEDEDNRHGFMAEDGEADGWLLT